MYPMCMMDFIIQVCAHPSLLMKLASQRLRIWVEHFFHCRESARSLDMSLAKTNLHQNRKGQETVRSFFSCFFLHHSFGFILRSMQKQRLHQDRFPRDVGLRAAHLAAGQ